MSTGLPTADIPTHSPNATKPSGSMYTMDSPFKWLLKTCPYKAFEKSMVGSVDNKNLCGEQSNRHLGSYREKHLEALKTLVSMPR